MFCDNFVLHEDTFRRAFPKDIRSAPLCSLAHLLFWFRMIYCDKLSSSFNNAWSTSLLLVTTGSVLMSKCSMWPWKSSGSKDSDWSPYLDSMRKCSPKTPHWAEGETSKTAKSEYLHCNYISCRLSCALIDYISSFQAFHRLLRRPDFGRTYFLGVPWLSVGPISRRRRIYFCSLQVDHYVSKAGLFQCVWSNSHRGGNENPSLLFDSYTHGYSS